MTTTLSATFIDDFKRAADEATSNEEKFRVEYAAKSREVEQTRAFAFRRLNLMKAVADAVALADSEEIAVANTLGVLRTKLSWHTDSEARTAVLDKFVDVGKAVFESFKTEGGADPKVTKSLAGFEAWYEEHHVGPFWVLFEHYIPETPRVDF